MELTDLAVSRKIPASAEDIYDAWIDPGNPGGPWFGVKRAIVNPVVDGLFYHTVEHAGRVWPHYGRFIRLDRPRTIEHTWVSEATQGVESVVTVTLEKSGDETEMTIRHAGVPNDQMGRQHKDGWTWMLNAIAERFTNK
jgi:uncharacterized protein YndB with AHSA1/START domain